MDHREDYIERFFRDNKKQFDSLRAEPEDFDRLMDQLEIPQASSQSNNWSKWLIAAFLVLGVGIAAWWFSTSSENPAPSIARTQPGLEIDDIFPEIALRDPDGKLIPLSSLKGKVVLVEFWASYSKVCTEDHCFFFKPVYDTFRDKGFEIYAVSVDSSALNWVEAIERDKLDWVNVSDLEGAFPFNDMTFDPHDLPMTFLLDENGRIIAKDIEAEQLKQTLDQLFAFN